MAEGEQFRINVSERSAKEFIREMRDVASHMVANAVTDEERDRALDLCDWADHAEQERKLAEYKAWFAELGRTPAADEARLDERITDALDERIAESKAGGWRWAGEQTWMDAHMPKLKAQAIADWLRGPG